MSLLGTSFGDSLPVNREELINICEQKISDGDSRAAALLAQKYKNRVIASGNLSDRQKAMDGGYACYLICKAMFTTITSGPDQQNYENFKAFFAGHRVGHVFFQELLMKNFAEWDESSEHYPYFKKLNTFYDSLFQKYKGNQDLERADIDANRLNDRAQNRY